MKKVKNMSLRVLAGIEQRRGAEHISTLNTVDSRGLLYLDQIKMIEAEDIYLRALLGHEMDEVLDFNQCRSISMDEAGIGF